MFGPDEYRYFCTELGKVAGAADEMREKVLVLRGEMFDDGRGTVEASNEALRDVTRRLTFILADLDSAVSALPVPTREER